MSVAPDQLGRRIDICAEEIRHCAAELQKFFAGVEFISQGGQAVNQQYLNLVQSRHQAAVDEMERLQGLPIEVAITREVVLNALADIPQLVEQILKLNEESRERGLRELADRPWERGSLVVEVPSVRSHKYYPTGGEKCGVCGKSFTEEEWDDRHSHPVSGEDVHPRCCPCRTAA